jgi:nitroreductase
MINDQNSFLTDVLFRRKSVRNYTGRLVNEEQITTLLKAAMAAPSGRNQQPWEFVVIHDGTTLERLEKELPYAKMVSMAGSAILVCGYSVAASRPGAKDLWEQDCAAATENILLAAESMGLGTVWTALHPYPERQQIVRSILGIPHEIFPFSLIPVGYPTGEDLPKTKFNPEKIHWGRW